MRTCSNGHTFPDQDTSDGTLLSSCPICNASLLITDSLKTGPNLITEALEGSASTTEFRKISDPSLVGDKTEPLKIDQAGFSNPGSQQTLELPENNSSNIVQQTESTKIFEVKEPTKVLGGQTTNHPTLPFDFKLRTNGSKGSFLAKLLPANIGFDLFHAKSFQRNIPSTQGI